MWFVIKKYILPSMSCDADGGGGGDGCADDCLPEETGCCFTVFAFCKLEKKTDNCCFFILICIRIFDRRKFWQKTKTKKKAFMFSAIWKNICVFANHCFEKGDKQMWFVINKIYFYQRLAMVVVAVVETNALVWVSSIIDQPFTNNKNIKKSIPSNIFTKSVLFLSLFYLQKKKIKIFTFRKKNECFFTTTAHPERWWL